jgi:hypothetical protein
MAVARSLGEESDMVSGKDDPLEDETPLKDESARRAEWRGEDGDSPASEGGADKAPGDDWDEGSPTPRSLGTVMPPD